MLDGIRIILVPAGSKLSYPLAILAYIWVSTWQILLAIRFIEVYGSKYKIRNLHIRKEGDTLIAIGINMLIFGILFR